MSEVKISQDALERLRAVLAGFRPGGETYGLIVEPRDRVLARFQPIFSPEHIPHLTEAEVHSFLTFENNKHWTGLQRQKTKICRDMDKLREALAVLLDESQPVEDRLDRADSMVHGLGRALLTAILLVAYPDRYGVWNTTSEGGMKELGTWPQFDRGESLGSRYVKLNNVFVRLRNDLNIDLWTLDAVWWDLVRQDIPPIIERPSIGGDGTPPPEPSQCFGLERHLQEFLRDNWDQTNLTEEWALHTEPGNDEAGYQYPCGSWRIDLLAKHKTEPRWLVIELKRDQTEDATVGQVLRYIGWVRKHLAEDGEEVKGLVIARGADDSLRYALSAVPNVDLLLYEVEFKLRPLEDS